MLVDNLGVMKLDKYLLEAVDMLEISKDTILGEAEVECDIFYLLILPPPILGDGIYIN